MVKTILKAVSLGVGVGSVVLLILDSIKERDVLMLLGIGLSCLAVSSLSEDEKKK